MHDAGIPMQQTVLPSKIASESLIALISFSSPPALPAPIRQSQASRLRQSGPSQSPFDRPGCFPRGNHAAPPARLMLWRSLPGRVEICQSSKIVLGTMPGTVRS